MFIITEYAALKTLGVPMVYICFTIHAKIIDGGYALEAFQKDTFLSAPTTNASEQKQLDRK